MDEKEVKKLLKAAVNQAGSQKSYAKKIGVSEQFLSDVLKGRRGISKAIRDALGLELQWEWKKKQRNNE